MKNVIFTSLLFALLLIFSSTPLAAVGTLPGKSTNEHVVDKSAMLHGVHEVDRSELENRLGRKLNLKERLGIKLLNRKIKKAKAKAAAGEDVSDRFDGLAITGFVVGLVGLLSLNPILGIIGIIFSAIALGRLGRTGRRGKGLAIAGLVCGVVASLLYLLVLAAFL